MKNPVVLEICADSVESALAAERGGAHRIELCSNLVEGGVTPSAGLISTSRSKLAISLFVMIRPRGGDFCYSEDEFESMRRDVQTAKQLGADGIVFGILTEDGRVDVVRTRHLVELARPLQCTFHRAFDMSHDLERSLQEILEAGANRVLTSGGEQKVENGMEIIAGLIRASGGRIAVMAGGGITESNVHRIITHSGAREVHASVQAHRPSPMRHRNEKISMGLIKGREYDRVVVLQTKVQRLLEAAANGDRRDTGKR